jgi:putative heme iron utilization protein
MSAATEARALVAGTATATLATVSEDGSPWASLVAFATRAADGAPILCVSDLAEHGRNLARDSRASLVVAELVSVAVDPLAGARVTLAGTALRTTDPADRRAFLGAVPGAEAYIDFADFHMYVLKVERVRWIAGFGRMETIEAADYSRAAPA